ncbi:MAG: hypothetical protein Fur0043_22970 [Anaerolineales bacterium]
MLPQAAHIFRQGYFIQNHSNLLKIQSADIFYAPMSQHLLYIPTLLEGVRQVNLLRAPNNVLGRVYGCHI